MSKKYTTMINAFMIRHALFHFKLIVQLQYLDQFTSTTSYKISIKIIVNMWSQETMLSYLDKIFKICQIVTLLPLLLIYGTIKNIHWINNKNMINFWKLNQFKYNNLIKQSIAHLINLKIKIFANKWNLIRLQFLVGL
jgi:hypothetical protein